MALSPSLLSPARLFPPLQQPPCPAASALCLGERCGLTRRLSVRLGYAGASNKNVIIALQVETADCIRNMEEIAAIPGVDMLFLGQNDLCMSMGLYEKYEFPHMYTSPELNAATTKLIYNARKNNKILGLFLFGTDRVGEFIDKGFNLIRSAATPALPSCSFAQHTHAQAWLVSLAQVADMAMDLCVCSIGNDLHHLLTQATVHVGALVDIAKEHGKDWQPTSYSSGIIALE